VHITRHDDADFCNEIWQLTDFAGTSNFLLVAWLTYGLNGHRDDRMLINNILLTVWGLRLGAFLVYRVHQVLQMFANLCLVVLIVSSSSVCAI